jgi:hypothetical protein
MLIASRRLFYRLQRGPSRMPHRHRPATHALRHALERARSQCHDRLAILVSSQLVSKSSGLGSHRLNARIFVMRPTRMSAQRFNTRSFATRNIRWVGAPRSACSFSLLWRAPVLGSIKSECSSTNCRSPFARPVASRPASNQAPERFLRSLNFVLLVFLLSCQG